MTYRLSCCCNDEKSDETMMSYVTDDRVFCVFDAPDEATMREHARIGALPLARVMQVRVNMGPWAAEPRREREVDGPRAPEG